MQEIKPGDTRVVDQRNKFGGRCFETGEKVESGEGWLGIHVNSNDRPRFIIFSEDGRRSREQSGQKSITRQELGKIMDTRESVVRRTDGSRTKNRKSRFKGETLGLPVLDTWSWVFAENERRYRENGDPMTDIQISEFMKKEFPSSPGKSKSVSRVRQYRGCYNARSHGFDRFEAPAHQSQEYGEDGQPIGSSSKSGSVNESRIREIVREEVGGRATTIQIQFTPRKKVEVSGVGKHRKFAEVLQKVAAKIPVLLVGPTGSGKSFLAEQVADALDLDYTFNSMSEGISESALLGRVLPDEDGNWSYQDSPFVKSFRDGGVHLLDEIDGSDPNLLVQVNAALANGMLSLPFASVEPIKQHKDSIIIAAANTYGSGGDRQYVGRNQLDAATLNRFTMGTVEIEYDEQVEKQIVDAVISKKSSTKVALLSWAHGIREKIFKAGLRRVMSTRNIEDAAKLIEAGMKLDDVKQTYFLGWSQDEKVRVHGSSAPAPRRGTSSIGSSSQGAPF